MDEFKESATPSENTTFTLVNEDIKVENNDDYIPKTDLDPIQDYFQLVEFFNQNMIDEMLDNLKNLYIFSNQNNILSISNFNVPTFTETFVQIAIRCDDNFFSYSLLILQNVIKCSKEDQFESSIEPMLNEALFQKLLRLYVDPNDIYEKRCIVNFLRFFNSFSQVTRDFSCETFDIDTVNSAIINSEDESQSLSINLLSSFLFYPFDEETLFGIVQFVSEGLDQVEGKSKYSLIEVVIEILKQNPDIAFQCQSFDSILDAIQDPPKDFINQTLTLYKYLLKSDESNIDPPRLLVNLLKSDSKSILNQTTELIIEFIRRNETSVQILCFEGMLSVIADILGDGTFLQKIPCCQIILESLKQADVDFIYLLLNTRSFVYKTSILSSITSLLSIDNESEFKILFEIIEIILTAPITNNAKIFAIKNFMESDGPENFDEILDESEDNELCERVQALKDMIIEMNEEGEEVEEDENDWIKIGEKFLRDPRVMYESSTSDEYMDSEDENEYIKRKELEDEEKKSIYY
ncbi:hypothetical protein TVAG_058740 [Trichomonas vaginalis G3]|uniref:Uncharacterized protein n=1 Tax=Trichomonas vaginalis (strain ATCC PRA-98 / G3) TaxID=412133 RepID=A2FJY8_TRIV3|nr:armadillo (ARM) repeat-containing protein family [Trichomonas vaginalis G3]EAX94784.1 hypothetical protein TVAG_058740 [Trichomonas vaginalis G3]KAI5518424.1 armadillo (ARM) repeat-containing protein family [Trichomonas vaginalis G3]|eukprot:XP_001307714.1 hypothetical protein [Trichomonas vaginalis G3]